MDAATWEATDDIRQLSAALPVPPGHRKFRLWGVGCARLLFHPTSPGPRYQQAAGSISSPAWRPIVDAAEEYADELIDARAFRARWNLPSGGPYNVYRYLAEVERFDPGLLVRSLAGCSRAFQAPTRAELCALFRDIFGNPFRPVAFDPAWRTSTAVALARQMYESRDFGATPILADAIQDAGCEHTDILDHCCCDKPHVRGCWVVDLVLGKS